MIKTWSSLIEDFFVHPFFPLFKEVSKGAALAEGKVVWASWRSPRKREREKRESAVRPHSREREGGGRETEREEDSRLTIQDDLRDCRMQDSASARMTWQGPEKSKSSAHWHIHLKLSRDVKIVCNSRKVQFTYLASLLSIYLSICLSLPYLWKCLLTKWLYRPSCPIPHSCFQRL